ncbi:MAG: SsrA-binding protein SmpB [Parcubacteria group bacterium]|nr:SsrA-binding protein SmpB [Parcubacteria group bacterium]
MRLIENRKAYFNYEVLEKFEAGLKLLGFEVKSLKGGQGSLSGAYIIVRGGEAFIVGMHIPPYQVKNTPGDYDPNRVRKLLLNRKEISEIAGYEKKKGLTIVPISVYNKAGKVKLEIAVARGKKKYDKRQAIKKRDTERDIGRKLRG